MCVWRTNLSLLAALALLGALGAWKLTYPLAEDQSLFLMGAELIRGGGVLYRDFWDIKPPGIFLWYLTAGAVFGFTDAGVRWFDLAYQLGFAVAISLGLRPLAGARVATLTALFTVGWYFTFLTEWQLALAEPLVQFPLFLSLLGMARAPFSRHPGRWLLLSGFSTGVVFLFKPLLCLIPAAVAGVWIRSLRSATIVIAGAALPVLGVFLWFGVQQALGELVSVLFLTPAELLQEGGRRPLQVLHGELMRYLKRAAPLVLGALGGLYLRRDKLTAGFALWIIAGVLAIMLQIRSWWFYHWTLLILPLAFLSAVSAEAFLRRVKTPATIAATVLVAGTALIPAVRKIRSINPTPWHNPVYLAELDGARLLAREPPGTIVAIWMPRLYRLAGRRPATTVHTAPWSWTRSQTMRLCNEVSESGPALILVQPLWLSTIQQTCLQHVLKSYQTVREARFLVWYRRLPSESQSLRGP
ncbi:MAG: glycosyltransferase family 39 protein [Bryobacteraceae bacterium]|nr:glycosyltransferase family 39 protein [Bryobacteraceae bacterium]